MTKELLVVCGPDEANKISPEVHVRLRRNFGVVFSMPRVVCYKKGCEIGHVPGGA